MIQKPRKALRVTTPSDLDRHLQDLGLQAGMAVAVHSRLLAFGRIEGGAETVFAALMRAVGPAGTVAVPTYTLNLTSETPYDPRSTPSHAAGALSEYVRVLPEARRSLCPMHGHAAVGRLAEVAVGADPSRSLGPGSAFDAMHGAGFHLLLLGCSFQEGATFVHHVEAVVGVPYRSWLALARKRREADGTVREVVCHYYGHEAPESFDNHLTVVEDEMRARGHLISAPAPYGSSHFMLLDRLYGCVADILARDPYGLVEPRKGDDR